MIYLNQIGKKFNQNWIFRGVNFTFEASQKYAILGSNGSGKSTLIRIVGNMQSPTVGRCKYIINNQKIATNKIYNYISFCAPAMEIVEEMTLKEFLDFHFSFKPLLEGFTVEKIIDYLNFSDYKNKLIHEFSSGMKQRVKLAQAFWSDTPILLLDEPCSNLDDQGIQMYQHLLENFTKNKTVLIGSNDEREYQGVNNFLSVKNFHP